MSFIRTKKIKGNEYAYIVENKWKSRGKRVRQKTKKYLGKVYRFERKDDGSADFYLFCGITDVDKYLSCNEKEQIILDLVRFEMKCHGFELDKEKGIWKREKEKEGCFFKEKGLIVYNEKGNDVALGLNQGFLTGYALRKILNFRADVEEEGYDFAKMIVEAGLNAPKEIFVGLFSKVYK